MSDPTFDDAAPIPDDNELAMVRKLAARLLELDDVVKETVQVMEALSKERRSICEHDMPSALLALGLTGFDMDTGHRVALESSVHANIAKDRAAEAYQWLRDNGFGDLIKRDLKISFGRDEDTLAAELAAELRIKLPGHEIDDKSAVHANTLKAFVKEQLSKGTDLPEDLLGIFTRREAVLIPPKKPKGVL